MARLCPLSFGHLNYLPYDMSRLLAALIFPLSILAMPASSWAGDDDHHHHHRKHRKEFREEYWDGNCKVERKWKRDGEYKEKRKCKDGYRHYHAPQRPVYVAPPVVHIPQPRPMVVLPRPEGLVIDSHIVLRP